MAAMAIDEAPVRAACEAGDWERATTLAIELYGSELLGYLGAILRTAEDADDVFATVCEQLWTSLPKFRWDSSLRTYAYTLSRNAAARLARDPHRRAKTPLSSSSVEAVVARVRSTTAPHLRSETKDALAAVRDELDADDQTLLILRVNRELPWRDIAEIMCDEEVTPDAIDRRAAALRKRFERLKLELREKLAR